MVANVATEIGRTASGMHTEVGNPVPVMALTTGLEPLGGIIHQGQRPARRGLSASDDVTIPDLETWCTAADAANPGAVWRVPSSPLLREIQGVVRKT